MKRWEFITSLVLAALCAVVSVGTILSAQANRRVQAELNAQQMEINTGVLRQQIGTNLIRDMAVASANNDALKDLLSRHGFTVTVEPAASPAPVDTP